MHDKKIALPLLLIIGVSFSILLVGFSAGTIIEDLRSLASPPSITGADCIDSSGVHHVTGECYGKLLWCDNGKPSARITQCTNPAYQGLPSCIEDNYTRVNDKLRCCTDIINNAPDHPVGSECGVQLTETPAPPTETIPPPSATLAFPPPTIAKGTSSGKEIAVWLHMNEGGQKTPQEVDILVETLKNASITTAYVQVRSFGSVYYLKGRLDPLIKGNQAMVPGFDLLEYFTKKAHEKGIKVEAWLSITPISYKNSTTNPPDHIYSQHNINTGKDHPEDPNWVWTSLDQNGNEAYSSDKIVYLDPGNPQVRQYLVNIMTGIAQNYDVDGIHLDYIRYGTPNPDNDEYFGYNPASLKLFREKYHKNADYIPEKKDKEFSDWRRLQVTSLLAEIRDAIKQIKPNIILSAAVIPWGNAPATDRDWYSSSAYSGVFQDWKSWLETGLIDIAIPMNYNRTTFLSRTDQNGKYIPGWIEFEQNLKKSPGTKIIPGFYVDTINNKDKADLPRDNPNNPLTIAQGLAKQTFEKPNLDGVAIYSYQISSYKFPELIDNIRNQL